MLRKKVLLLSNLSLFVLSFDEKLFQKEKKICYGFMPGDFQIICGSVVGEIRRSPA